MEINLTKVKPLFAHDVAISASFKARKTGEEIEKEANIELVFLDVKAKQAIARITLPLITVKDLPRLLNDTLEKIDKELKSKEMPKAKKIETKSTKANYLG